MKASIWDAFFFDRFTIDFSADIGYLGPSFLFSLQKVSVFCPNCGANIDDRSVVCANCGTQINRFQAVPAYGSAPSKVPTDRNATTSMILGIVSLVCCGAFAGIPAIIFGHMARKNIRDSMGGLQGDGMALAGIIMGYISVAYNILAITVLILLAVQSNK